MFIKIDGHYFNVALATSIYIERGVEPKVAITFDETNDSAVFVLRGETATRFADALERQTAVVILHG